MPELTWKQSAATGAQECKHVAWQLHRVPYAPAASSCAATAVQQLLLQAVQVQECYNVVAR